jgi:dipeptidyl aminopeptidase/acylaminoacyl peptidase
LFSQDSLQKPVPANILFKKLNQHDFTVSPNGKYFAEVYNNNAETEIVIINIEKFELHKRIQMGKRVVSNLVWLTNNRLIYESIGEVLAIDIDGSNSLLIVDRLADKLTGNWNSLYKNIRINRLLSLLPNNKNEVLIETYDYKGFGTVKRVNIFTGQKITVLSGKAKNIHSWITDLQGRVRFGIRIDEGDFIYYKVNKEYDDVKPLIINIKGVKIPLVVSARSYLNLPLKFEQFGLDENIIYLSSNYESDRRKLLEYNLETNEVTRIIAEDANCDIKVPNENDAYLIFDYKNNILAGVKYECITPQFKWFSEDFKIVYEEMKIKFPSSINEIIDSDINNTIFLIYQWSDNKAGNIGIYNAKDKTYRAILFINEELDKFKLSKIKSFITKSRDNYRIPCYLNLPIGYSKEKSYPLIVIPHGGPWSRDYWSFDDFSQYFTSRGYVTLRVNFRGSTGFGTKHILSGIHSMDEIMISDIADGVNFVKENYNINENEVFIFGHSYGGYASYMSIIKYPNLYASAVVLSAPTDIKAWMKLQKNEKNYFAYEFWNTALGSNKSKYLNKISPINYANQFERPLLIFHGRRDEIIPIDQAQSMIEKLNKYNKNAKLEILQTEGHSIKDANSLGYILDAANDFFKANTLKK